MSNVVSVIEVPMSGGDTFKSDAGGKGATRKFVVSVTTLGTLSTLIDDVFATLPVRGNVHPRCSSIYVNSVNVTMRGEDNRTYDAVVEYTNRVITTTVGRPIRTTKPWDEGASLSFQTWQGDQRPIRQAFAKMTTGKPDALYNPVSGEWKGVIVQAGPMPILNTAGDSHLDPPMTVDYGLSMLLSWAIPDGAFDFQRYFSAQNTINGVDINVGGRFTIPKWWGLISAVEAVPKEYFEDDPTTSPSSWPSELYWELSVNILINPASWNISIMERGFREKYLIDATEYVRDIRVDGDGPRVQTPVPLDASGHPINLGKPVAPEDTIHTGWMVKLPTGWDYLTDITSVKSFAVYKTKRT